MVMVPVPMFLLTVPVVTRLSNALIGCLALCKLQHPRILMLNELKLDSSPLLSSGHLPLKNRTECGTCGPMVGLRLGPLTVTFSIGHAHLGRPSRLTSVGILPSSELRTM